MRTHCQRCGKPMDPGFRYGRRKYHVSCRARIQHELNVKKARREGYRQERKRPFWVWFPVFLKEVAKEAQCDPVEPVMEPLLIDYPTPYSMKRQPSDDRRKR